ncbi:hypothetical protein ACEXQD_09015 [Herbiconiux sp. P15]|uniref:hypothetical protein n=1 Tax=Herbiconiux liukaitaii TaxID=3342799 RepID=UPI0035B81A59
MSLDIADAPGAPGGCGASGASCPEPPAPTGAAGIRGSSSRAALVARAAPSVGRAIARSHAVSLREAGDDSAQGEWIRFRLDRELAAARAFLQRALADGSSHDDAELLAELFELCCIWRDSAPEFAEHELTILTELACRHGILVPNAPSPRTPNGTTCGSRK